MNDASQPRDYNFEELKMLYDSTIQVTEWRNAANRFYYSVTVAIFAAMGFTYFFGYEESNGDNTRNIALAGIFLLAIFGIFASRTWIRLLNYYYGLNNAKFDALRLADPGNIFIFEYAVHKDLQKRGKIKLIQARRAEKTIPYISLIIFSSSLVVLVTLLNVDVTSILNQAAQSRAAR